MPSATVHAAATAPSRRLAITNSRTPITIDSSSGSATIASWSGKHGDQGGERDEFDRPAVVLLPVERRHVAVEQCPGHHARQRLVRVQRPERSVHDPDPQARTRPAARPRPTTRSTRSGRDFERSSATGIAPKRPIPARPTAADVDLDPVGHGRSATTSICPASGPVRQTQVERHESMAERQLRLHRQREEPRLLVDDSQAAGVRPGRRAIDRSTPCDACSRRSSGAGRAGSSAGRGSVDRPGRAPGRCRRAGRRSCRGRGARGSCWRTPSRTRRRRTG